MEKENNNRNRVYYFNFAGEPVLYYDLELGTVEWSFQGNIKKITVKNMKQELLGYDIEGKYLFKTSNPSEFEMLYFAKLRDNIMVVCDGNKNQEDQYGRFRYNYLIDINTGKLTKGSLAY